MTLFNPVKRWSNVLSRNNQAGSSFSYDFWSTMNSEKLLSGFSFVSLFHGRKYSGFISYQCHSSITNAVPLFNQIPRKTKQSRTLTTTQRTLFLEKDSQILYKIIKKVFQWLLLRTFGLLTSLLYSQLFDRYVLRPFSNLRVHTGISKGTLYFNHKGRLFQFC